MRRVVITGMGAVSPYGWGVGPLVSSLKAGASGVVKVPYLSHIIGLRSFVAGLVPQMDQKQIPRKNRRSMSAMSVYAAMAGGEALRQAGLTPADCATGRMGVSLGSTVGSPQTLEGFFGKYLSTHGIDQTKSTVFLKVMSHSSASNLAQLFGITGRVLAPSAACATGCQAVGLAHEMIAFGKQDIMLCGGTDEYHPLTTATFDILNAASTSFNDRPHETPRPFDRNRDGIVCSEGCGILILECLESARGRNATIYAELAGFSTVSDSSNIANPDVSSIEKCMQDALTDASVRMEEIDYINAHATATLRGDIAECEAIGNLFGNAVPVSSLKGHMGHTMAASGALELIAIVDMMNNDYILPTLNLDEVDPACQHVRHVRSMERRRISTILKNNFALGGVNSSVLLRRYPNE